MIIELYLIISGIIFGLVSIFHLCRAIKNLRLMLGTWDTPVTLSWIVGLLTGIMSIYAFSFLLN
jgi:hypothetical protein